MPTLSCPIAGPPPHLMYLPVSQPNRSKPPPAVADFQQIKTPLAWKMGQLATCMDKIKRRRAARLGKDPARNSMRLQLHENWRRPHAAEAGRRNLDYCLGLVSLLSHFCFFCRLNRFVVSYLHFIMIFLS